MSILKNSKFDIKPFEFGSLVPQNNEFTEGEISEFEMKSLKDAANIKNDITDDIIRAERKYEAGSSFEIDPVIREHRGLNRQEAEDFENAVSEEVEKRLKQLSNQAYQEGVSAGRQEGMVKAYDEALLKFEEKIIIFAQQIEQLEETKKNILESSRDEGYKLIKNLTKWIALKEVDDKEYIPRLLEKLILEMNTKSNLLIRVDNNSFQYMPEVLQHIENKLGQLTNVRVEVEEDMQGKGIILESENGIIEGTLEAQFASIDKLFEAVGVND